ncbi:hypothetical protein ACQP2F_15240 [Actinoplanes sp. CA-030573]|uniref:hypothetical protein n=1 Tax=Actinoplanes sp. CA-030573 TaxID=3239898 RepID=UPI003D8A7EA3
MLTLLAVLCWCRLTEVTDSLVESFVDLVRVINTRAERRVDKAQLRSSAGSPIRRTCC